MIIIMIILIYMWIFNFLKLKCDGIMVYVYININMYVKYLKIVCKIFKDMYDMIKVYVFFLFFKCYYYLCIIFYWNVIFYII